MKKQSILEDISRRTGVVFVVAILVFTMTSTTLSFYEFDQVKQEIASNVSQQIKRQIERSQNSGSVLYLQRDIQELVVPYQSKYPLTVIISDPNTRQVVASLTNAEMGIFTVRTMDEVQSKFGLLPQLRFDLAINIDRLVFDVALRIFLFALSLLIVFRIGARVIRHQNERKLLPIVEFLDWAEKISISQDGQLVYPPQSTDGAVDLTAMKRVADKFNSLSIKLKDAEVDREIGKIAAQVAHDLRSPVGAIKVVFEQLTFPSTEHERLLKSALSRINQITDDLLSSRKQKKLQPTSNRIFLNELIEQIINEKKIQARSSDLIINLQNANITPIFTSIDESDLGRILSNILTNAIESLGSEGGRVDISVTSSNKSHMVTVVDNGSGISHNILTKLKMGQSITTKDKGSGIGITSSKTILESIGGKLEIQSVEAKGTLVTIEIPKLV